MPEQRASNPPIQVFPKGLLGFLELKRGNAPSVLPNDLQLDVLRWLTETNSENLAEGPLALAAGNNMSTAFTVPANEWWLVHDVGAFLEATDATGAVNAILMAIHAGGASGQVPLGGFYQGFTAGVAGNDIWIGGAQRGPFWLGPGGGIFIHAIPGSFANTMTRTLYGRISRLPI